MLFLKLCPPLQGNRLTKVLATHPAVPGSSIAIRRMPKELSSYRKVLKELRPALHNLPGKLIGIDGRNGVGKTTLGRFLAWQFNVTLIESDLFLLRNTGSVDRRIEEIDRLIECRLQKPRPVILEGVMLFSMLNELNRMADYVVYCQSANYSPGNPLEPMLQKYEEKYLPTTRSNLVVDLDWEFG